MSQAGRVYRYEGVHYLVLDEDGYEAMRMESVPSHFGWPAGQVVYFSMPLVESYGVTRILRIA